MIHTIGGQRILITESLKKSIKETESPADQEIYDLLSNLHHRSPTVFRETCLNFDLDGEEAQVYVIALLNDYVSGGKGQFKIDDDLNHVYWLDIWINGQLLIRTLKLSDYVRIKIDLENVVKLQGQVEDFVIEFKNGNCLRFNENIIMN
ncbi:hypothetical protein [Fusibacter ferrireducens]|uniref:Uncharacterized protein n=1 Tax=Fusibacter ferrireducens TaxID=2785058 RepID=A0ABR9ZNG1_9FIRM|nr:hypothetical protein [Fusibacter ferrireducens]MBF4692002.1 hypothetical protein [Fusibacter ferrireducens]